MASSAASDRDRYDEDRRDEQRWCDCDDASSAAEVPCRLERVRRQRRGVHADGTDGEGEEVQPRHWLRGVNATPTSARTRMAA
jgi:hypothetical protein